ncbi:MAG: hypothetical protein RLP44_24500 [Aggregatilineales bacterium]
MPDQETPLNLLFKDALRVMEKLGDTFTAASFIRMVARNDQAAYIHLLTEYVDDKQPFIAANTAIENRLNEVAPGCGYLPAEEKTLDTDLFGKLQKVVLYRRVSDVVQSDTLEQD